MGKSESTYYHSAHDMGNSAHVRVISGYMCGISGALVHWA